MSEWSRRIVERHWGEVGLPAGQDVAVVDYLSAVRARGIDKNALFEELVAAQGVPCNWRDFEAIPLELIWHEDAGNGSCFVAFENIAWWYRADEDEDVDEGYDDADLTLRVASAGESAWLWEVILDEEAAGGADPVLAHGASATLEEAKATCEESALKLIAREKQRSAQREANERQ